jgi:hypothetical protein
MEDAMITLRMEPQQFAALCAADDPDAPIDPSLLAQVRSVLAEAKATALPGLPILITLQSADELTALAACFEVGGEDNPNVSESQWESVLALIEQAARSQQTHSAE